MAKASKQGRKQVRSGQSALRDRRAERRELQRQIKAERDIMRLTRQLDQLTRSNAAKLAGFGAHLLERSRQLLAADAKHDLAREAARSSAPNPTIESSGDSYRVAAMRPLEHGVVEGVAD